MRECDKIFSQNASQGGLRLPYRRAPNYSQHGGLLKSRVSEHAVPCCLGKVGASSKAFKQVSAIQIV